jgi:2-keto-4-pentenoate hydratase
MTSSTDVEHVAGEIADAYRRQLIITPPSARIAEFDLAAGYAVEAALVARRRAAGHHTVGRKVGFANKAVWRGLKLDTLVWAHMYEDTVRYAPGNSTSLSVSHMTSAKIEPEIVFKMRATPGADAREPADILASVEWLALGFEIIDCVFTDWKFQPADFLAAYGLHAALVVGEPHDVHAGNIATLAEALATFRLTLSRDGDPVAEGSGRNSLRSPALCLAELASAIARRTPDQLLAPHELVSSGTLTESQPIASGQTWTAVVDGLPLPALTLDIQ